MRRSLEEIRNRVVVLLGRLMKRRRELKPLSNAQKQGVETERVGQWVQVLSVHRSSPPKLVVSMTLNNLLKKGGTTQNSDR